MRFSSTWPCCMKASGHRRSCSARCSMQPKTWQRKQSRLWRSLSGAVRSFQSLLDDLLATRVLHEREARLFLRSLVNYDATHAAAFHCEPGERLDTTTLDSEVEIY